MKTRAGLAKGRRHLRATAALFVGVCLMAASLFPVSCGRSGPEPSVDGIPGGSEASPENRYSFLLCGDPHGRTDLLARIVRQAREGEFLVVLGDLSTGKGVEELRGVKDFLDACGIPYHVVPGDNDMPRGDRSAYREVFGSDYYSLDVQGSHLVFLNNAVQGTGCPPEVLSWLRDDLGGAEGRLVIAFAHVPPGAPVDIGDSGFLEEETASNREMRDLLAAAGAPVIYCGHIHAYMVYSYGPPRVVVSGGAGARPHLSEESGGFHHFLRVFVEGDEVTEEVIPLQ